MIHCEFTNVDKCRYQKSTPDYSTFNLLNKISKNAMFAELLKNCSATL